MPPEDAPGAPGGRAPALDALELGRIGHDRSSLFKGEHKLLGERLNLAAFDVDDSGQFVPSVARGQWRGGGSRTPSTLHDFRHSFAVRTLEDWNRAGADVHALLPRLSTYLGHVDPAATYWYLRLSPELESLAAQRFERAGVR